MLDLLNLLSSSVIFLYVIPIALFLMTSNVIHLFGLTGLYGTMLLSEFLKNYVIQDVSPRPPGAANCNIMCDDGNQAGKPGMPSSHSAQAAFFSSFYYYQTTNPLVRGGLVVYAVAVMASRYLKRCHTYNQIGAGAILGLTLSWFILKTCVNYRA
jgi:membrane-associated phospholipid phosphatase